MGCALRRRLAVERPWASPSECNSEWSRRHFAVIRADCTNVTEITTKYQLN